MKISLKITAGIVGAWLILGSMPRALMAEDLSRAGRWGIGPDIGNFGNGIGARYWFTDRLGVDAGANFTLEDHRSTYRNRSYGFNGGMILLLKKKGGLRFQGLLGANYNRYMSDEPDRGSGSSSFNRDYYVTAGVGLSAEYSFQELPDLGFEAFTSGFGVEYIHTRSAYTSSFGGETRYADDHITYLSNPNIGLAIRYYF